MDGGAVARKVRHRLAWPCALFLLLSSLDRANVSFAAARMNAELGFSPAEYGLGAGILFVGFLAGQFPSILLLQRVGFRRWLACCALLWGCAAAAMAFIHTTTGFYLLRIVLGLAEGGLAPGIVLYLSQFATERQRATAFSLPMLAIPVSVIIGAPLSGVLLSMDAPLGLPGWRFMFLAEAVPTLLAAVLALFWFPDSPSGTRWLAPAEREWLATHAARRAGVRERNDWRVLREPVVPLAGLLWFCLLSGSYGVIFWLPQVLGSLTGLTPMGVGIVGALPWVAVAIGMYANAMHSDRTGERVWHIAAPALLAAAALLVAWQAGAGPVGLFALVVAGLGLGASQGAFWALPTSVMKPATLPLAVVAINIAGSAGGLVMPHAMGVAREASGGFALPTMLVVVMMLAATLFVAAIRLRYRATFTAARSASVPLS